uniref:Uncharacterized protein n=1 Tax=Strigamia maritima TaxID=126957 RepID=T1JHX9_STRMM
FKDGVPIGRRAAARAVATVDLKGTCKLVIHGATMEDNGQYTCVAENAFGQDEVTTSVDIKRKHSRSNISDYLPPKNYGSVKESPIFLTHLIDKIVLLGSTVVLQCEVTATPRPEVVWLHNGLELHQTVHIRISEHGCLHTLTICDVSYSDLGIYSCRASNGFGVAHSTSCLTFGLKDEDMEFGVAAMFIAKPTAAVSIQRTKDLVLSVEVEGEPKPKVTWLKSARDISRSVRAYKDVQGSTHKLVIRNAMLADSGEYTVETSNALGRDSARFMVDVTPATKLNDRVYDYRKTADILSQLQYYRQTATSIKELPGPIAGEPQIIEIGRNWVTLLWPRPNFDGGSSLLAYKIESREIGFGIWEEVGLSPITICDVYNLKSDCEYEFRVSARNKLGWGESICTTTPIKIVKRPHLPHFERLLPSNVKSHIGAEVILSCNITGYPDPEIRWFKDDCNVPLLPDSRHGFTYDGFTASLIIRNVHFDDSGEYICEASNLGGRLTTFTRLLVMETKVEDVEEIAGKYYGNSTQTIYVDQPSFVIPEFTMKLKDRRVKSGNLIRFSCQATGIPLPTISWFIKGVLVTSSDNCITFKDGDFDTLEIPRAGRDDAGEYLAVARNDHGIATSKCTLEVEVFQADLAFIRHLENKTVRQGSAVTLDGVIFCNSTSNMTWQKDGQDVTGDCRHSLRRNHDGRCALTISDVRPEDSGTYVVTVSGDGGSVASSSATLKVLAESSLNDSDDLERSTSRNYEEPLNSGYSVHSLIPIFIKKPRSTGAVEGDAVELLCEVSGDPKPEVLWLRDGLGFEYQRNPERFLRLGDGPSYRLEIPFVSIDDTGTYYVIAHNCHGEAKAIISLQVSARGQGGKEEHSMSSRHPITVGKVATRPNFIRPLENVKCREQESVVLECQVQASPLPEIRWERDGHVIHNSPDFRPDFDGRVCRLKINDVYLEDAGEFTCVAYNDAGKVTSSAFLTVDELEDEVNTLCTGHQHARPARKRVRIDTALSKTRRRFFVPRFLTQPHNRVAEEGETVRFSCAVVGLPFPIAWWQKDGSHLYTDGRVTVSNKDDVFAIEIRDVKPTDAGTYTVTLENTAGQSFSSARLDVVWRKGVRAPNLIMSPTLRSYSPTHHQTSRPSSRSETHSPYYGQRFGSPCLDDETKVMLQRSPITMSMAKTRPRKPVLEATYDGTKAGLKLQVQSQKTDRTRSSSVPSTARNKSHIAPSSRAQRSQSPVPIKQRAINTTRSSRTPYRSVSPSPVSSRSSTSSTVGSKTSSSGYSSDSIKPIAEKKKVDVFTRLSQSKKTLKNMPESKKVPRTTCKTSSNSPLITRIKLKKPRKTNSLACIKKPAPRFEKIVHDVVAELHGKVEIEMCLRARALPCHVTWFHEDEAIISGGNVYPSLINERSYLTCRLVIDPVQRESAGKFRCRASNRFATTEAVCFLHVLDSVSCTELINDDISNSPSAPDPIIASSSSNHLSISHDPCVNSMMNGNDAVSTTHKIHETNTDKRAKGYSDPTPNLEKENYLQKTPSILVVCSNDHHLPELLPLSKSYSCNEIPYLTYSTERRRSSLKESPAHIVKGPEDITVLRGGKVVLRVHFVGHPPPTVTWTKSGRKLVQSERVSIEIEDNMSVVRLVDVDSDDSGKYEVSVENEHYKDTHFSSVAVEGAPEPPADCPNVAEVTSSSVTLLWYGAAYDGGSIITGYVVELRLARESQWQVATSNTLSTTYKVKNLLPGSEYVFRIRAQNVHGVSAPSKESETVYIPNENEPTEFKNGIHIQHRSVIIDDSGTGFSSRYQRLEEIGRGRFGLVYKVIEKESQLVCAAKIIKCIKSTDKQKVDDEIKIMNKLDHPKLIKLIAAFKNTRDITMIVEYISGGELFVRVTAEDFILTEKDSILFMRQICEGVRYMHEKNVMHLDLKPENILCLSSHSHQIKLIDFGLARNFDPKNPLKVMFGTPEFVAPEIINYDPITPATDMWSVGVICYILLSGLSPFMGENDSETFNNITIAEFDFDDDAFTDISKQAKNFVTKLLVKKIEKRMTAQECLRDQWLAQQERTMSTLQLSTSNLKSFLSRRKWQKTGNAILALQRLKSKGRSASCTDMSTSSSSPNNSLLDSSISEDEILTSPQSPRKSVNGQSAKIYTSKTTCELMTIGEKTSKTNNITRETRESNSNIDALSSLPSTSQADKKVFNTFGVKLRRSIRSSSVPVLPIGKFSKDARIPSSGEAMIVSELPEKLVVKAGSMAMFEVEIESKLKVQVSWYKDGEQIFGDRRRIFSSSGNRMYSLRILNANLNDVGRYKCLMKSGEAVLKSEGSLSIVILATSADVDYMADQKVKYILK